MQLRVWIVQGPFLLWKVFKAHLKFKPMWVFFVIVGGFFGFFYSQSSLIAPKSLGAQQCVKVKYLPWIPVCVWPFLALKASPRFGSGFSERQRIFYTCECKEHYLVRWGIFFFSLNAFLMSLVESRRMKSWPTAMLHKIEYPLFLPLS